MEVIGGIMIVVLVIFGVKGAGDSSDLNSLELNVKSEKSFKLHYEYSCQLTEKGKKQKELEIELDKLK